MNIWFRIQGGRAVDTTALGRGRFGRGRRQHGEGALAAKENEKRIEGVDDS